MNEKSFANYNHIKKHLGVNKVKAYLTLIRPEMCVMGLIITFIGGVTGGFQYASFDLLLAMIAVFLMTAGSMAFNDYFDREIDKIAHPKRAIPSARLLPEEGLQFALLSFFIALVLSLAINMWCFGIIAFGMGFLVLYEKFFKNQALVGNIVVAFLSGVAFIFGGVSVGRPYDAVILSVIAFLVMLDREILMDVRDIEGDTLRRTTLPMKIGKKNTIYLGYMIMVTTIVLTPFPAFWNILSWWYLIIIIPVDLLFMYAILLSFKDIQNISRTTDIMRTGMAFGLIGFIVGVVT